MFDPAVPLTFSNSFIRIITNSYILYRALLTLNFYKKILRKIFNKTNRCIFKSGAVVGIEFLQYNMKSFDYIYSPPRRTKHNTDF